MARMKKSPTNFSLSAWWTEFLSEPSDKLRFVGNLRMSYFKTLNVKCEGY